MIHATADEALTDVLNMIMATGKESAPRGKKIKEIVGHSVAFDMRWPLVTKKARAIGYRFYPAEAAWILSGRNDKKFFEDLKMPFIWEFSDDGNFYQGAYGTQVVEQLSYVCDMLSDDPDTRQAVMTIWRQNPRPSRDIPCTVSYQFIAREGRLHCIQSMRSSDAWLGYPYDAFNAAMLTSYIILLLKYRKARGRSNLKLGYHHLFAGSMHVYEPQWEGAMQVIADSESFPYSPLAATELESPAVLIEYLTKLAQHENGIDPRK